MKKIIALLIMMVFLTTHAFAFLYEVKVYTKEEMQRLTTDQLIDVFKDAVIERKASETFHGKAGFTPKEYESYKKLLGLIVALREEMKVRELEPPPVEDWLR